MASRILHAKSRRKGVCLDFRVQGLGSTLRLLGLFGACWGKVWALGAKVWDPILKVQEP